MDRDSDSPAILAAEVAHGPAAKYPKVRIERLDVTNLEQAKRLAKKLAGVPIDVLINMSKAALNREMQDAGRYRPVPALRRSHRAVVIPSGRRAADR